MSGDGGSGKVPPFPRGYRASGVLLHVTSMPSPYGIGDLGSAAFSWIDRLHTAGQRWWQVLPLGPTGYGDSPYQSMSSFAGNPGLISPDSLISDGLLKMADCQTEFPPHIVDYDAVIPFMTVAPQQDLLNFGAESRMNIPGRASGNGRWRSPDDLESSSAFEWLQELTELSKRVESEKIEQPANSKRSGVPRAMMSEAV